MRSSDAMSLSLVTSLILRHTRPSRLHLTPEIVLRLITPQCELWRAREGEGPFKDPFWAFYWPGGQAAARYILDNGDIVKNRTVLDIGCGCGAGSIAAAKMKAKTVVANDIDPVAVAATKINAIENEVSIQTCTKNYIGEPLTDFDAILIGDMFYDEEFAVYLFKWLRTLALEGKTIVIGDPGRHDLTQARRSQIKMAANYQLSELACMENNGFTHAAVWIMNTK